MFLSNEHSILVANRTPVAFSSTIRNLEANSLSSDGRPGEHCSFCLLMLLRPFVVSKLCVGAKAIRNQSVDRPDCCWRIHVGMRLNRFPDPRGCFDHAEFDESASCSASPCNEAVSCTDSIRIGTLRQNCIVEDDVIVDVVAATRRCGIPFNARGWTGLIRRVVAG